MADRCSHSQSFYNWLHSYMEKTHIHQLEHCGEKGNHIHNIVIAIALLTAQSNEFPVQSSLSGFSISSILPFLYHKCPIDLWGIYLPGGDIIFS